jgi:hypothetical protein
VCRYLWEHGARETIRTKKNSAKKATRIWLSGCIKRELPLTFAPRITKATPQCGPLAFSVISTWRSGSLVGAAADIRTKRDGGFTLNTHRRMSLAGDTTKVATLNAALWLLL